MQQLLAVAVGGALGAVLRLTVSLMVGRAFGQGFPFATLLVNVLGSLLAGLFFVWLVERSILSIEWRYMVIVGLLGAFTTFSSFSIDTLLLLESGELVRAAVNVVLNLSLCLAATWLGLVVARSF